MDIERYRSLAEAYGSDVRRWPQDIKPAADAFASREPEAARAALHEAALLDEALDAWRAPAVDAALRDRVLVSAPTPRARSGLIGRFGFWLSGAGLAAACAAGVIVGMAGSAAAVSDAQADELLAAATPVDTAADILSFTVSDRDTVRRDA